MGHLGAILDRIAASVDVSESVLEAILVVLKSPENTFAPSPARAGPPSAGCDDDFDERRPRREVGGSTPARVVCTSYERVSAHFFGLGDRGGPLTNAGRRHSNWNRPRGPLDAHQSPLGGGSWRRARVARFSERSAGGLTLRRNRKRGIPAAAARPAICLRRARAVRGAGQKKLRGRKETKSPLDARRSPIRMGSHQRARVVPGVDRRRAARASNCRAAARTGGAGASRRGSTPEPAASGARERPTQAAGPRRPSSSRPPRS